MICQKLGLVLESILSEIGKIIKLIVFLTFSRINIIEKLLKLNMEFSNEKMLTK